MLVTPILEFDLVDFSSWSSCCLLFLAYVSLFVSGGSSFVVTYVSSPKDAEFQKRVENRVDQFRENIDNDEGNTKYNPDLNANFSRKEVKTGIGKGGSKKTPNDDGIMNEMLKKGGQRLLTALVMLMNILWMLEVTSEFWKLSVIKPVYKKGSPFNPKNYRPISLLSNLFKLYERLIDVRVRAIVGLPPKQCAYRSCFGTETELLRLSILFQYCKNRNIPIFVGFLDLEQAFERAWRVGILYQLWVFYRRFTKVTYNELKTY